MDQQTGHYDLVKKLHSACGLQIAHININGLFKKMEEVKLLLKETKLDLLAITESHLDKDLHTDNEINIDNYSFLRKDRTGQKNHWGGVILYYKSSLEVLQLKIGEDLETIFTEVVLKSQKLFVGCIYRPPNEKNFILHFNALMKDIQHLSLIHI